MTNSLLGIPLPIVSLACFGIAVVYYFVWPKPKAGQTRTRARHLILRYAHSLVWVLLAAACLLWAINAGVVAGILGYLALGTYALFMIAFLTSRKV